MKQVVIAPAARVELEAAAAWYEARAAGLGGRFLARVDDALRRLSEQPETFPVWETDQ
jgi:plasmid stabilization system protein ParE